MRCINLNALPCIQFRKNDVGRICCNIDAEKIKIRYRVGINISKGSGMRSWCLMFGVARYGLQVAGSGPGDGKDKGVD